MNYIADKIKGRIDFQIAKYFYFCSTFGEMAEWSNALVLKTSEGFALQRFESSRLRMYFLSIDERKNINADC